MKISPNLEGWKHMPNIEDFSKDHIEYEVAIIYMKMHSKSKLQDMSLPTTGAWLHYWQHLHHG
jgi:hypothetical protein